MLITEKILKPPLRLNQSPVFGVWLQVCDQVTRPRLHGDGLVPHGDQVRRDVRTVAAGLLPLQEEAGRRGVARLRGRRRVQQRERRHQVGGRRWRPEAHLLAVRTSACVVHRLEKSHFISSDVFTSTEHLTDSGKQPNQL